MKKLICFVITITLLILTFTGCSNTAAEPDGSTAGEPITQSDQTLEAYLSDSVVSDYLISTDTALDLTGVIVAADKTIIIKDSTLTFTGELSPGNGCVTVRSEGDNATLDMSGVTLAGGFAPDAGLFEVHKQVAFTGPTAMENIRIEHGDEWTSIRSASPSEGQQPVEESISVTTPEGFMQFFNDPSVTMIELASDMTVDLSGAELSRELRVDYIGDHALTLTGELTVRDGGMLDIGAAPDATGTIDISGLSVKAEGIDTAGASNGSIGLIRLQLNFKQITGEPVLAEGLSYVISDDGKQANVNLVIGPDLGAQILEDIPLVLIGQGEGLMNSITTELVPSGELVVELDNPIITDEIWVDVGGGFTLKLTGSVTFDGGHYRFGFVDGTEGRATVDISELTINATDAVGETKSDNIVFWRERDGIDVLYDGTNEHLSYTFGGSGNDELRFVQ